MDLYIYISQDILILYSIWSILNLFYNYWWNNKLFWNNWSVLESVLGLLIVSIYYFLIYDYVFLFIVSKHRHIYISNLSRSSVDTIIR